MTEDGWIEWNGGEWLVEAKDYAITYNGSTDRCPGCSYSNWYVGRITAECAFCGTALLLSHR